jgi:hypothetical protein
MGRLRARSEMKESLFFMADHSIANEARSFYSFTRVLKPRSLGGDNSTNVLETTNHFVNKPNNYVLFTAILIRSGDFWQ